MSLAGNSRGCIPPVAAQFRNESLRPDAIGSLREDEYAFVAESKLLIPGRLLEAISRSRHTPNDQLFPRVG